MLVKMSDLIKPQPHFLFDFSGGNLNPDLYFGRAQVYRYLEEYTLSCIDYSKALSLDPLLPSKQALKEMEAFITKSYYFIQNRKGISSDSGSLVNSKKLAQIASGLTQYELPKGVPYDLSSLKKLNTGLNAEKAIALKMICPIGQNDFPPS